MCACLPNLVTRNCIWNHRCKYSMTCMTDTYRSHESHFTPLWLFFLQESSEGRKCIPKSASHGSFGVHTMYKRHSYTPSLSRSTQHFHRPGENSKVKYIFYELCREVNPTSLTCALFYHLPLSPFCTSYSFCSSHGILSGVDVFSIFVLSKQWHKPHFPFMSSVSPWRR